MVARWVIAILMQMAFLSGNAVAQEALNGRYLGIGDAEGAVIEIAPDRGGYSGSYRDPVGATARFKADNIENTAETVLDMGGQTVLMRIAPLPYGAEVAVIPFGADGGLIIESSRLLDFLREGLSLPETPDQYIEPPRAGTRSVAANGFLLSYEFWPPAGVRDGYLALPDRFRTLMRMFPEVQVDVLWKLCLAPGAEPALAIALRGQGVQCDQIISMVKDLQRDGRFERYKDDVARARETLRQSVRCADGYVEARGVCAAAAKALSEAAISLQTAQNVVARWQ